MKSLGTWNCNNVISCLLPSPYSVDLASLTLLSCHFPFFLFFVFRSSIIFFFYTWFNHFAFAVARASKHTSVQCWSCSSEKQRKKVSNTVSVRKKLCVLEMNSWQSRCKKELLQGQMSQHFYFTDLATSIVIQIKKHYISTIYSSQTLKI